MTNNFIEIRMGRGVFELGNPERRGAHAVLKIIVEGGGGVKKPCLPLAGGVDFFWNNPLPFSWYKLFIARKFMSSQRTIFSLLQ